MATLLPLDVGSKSRVRSVPGGGLGLDLFMFLSILTDSNRSSCGQHRVCGQKCHHSNYRGYFSFVLLLWAYSA
jgi:hypothetical protein